MNTEDLVTKIRTALPMAKTITDLEPKEKPEAATFRGQGLQFLVLPSMEVFELSGTNRFVTGSSMLIQMLLTNKGKTGKVLASVVDVLREAEGPILSRRRNGIWDEASHCGEKRLGKAARRK